MDVPAGMSRPPGRFVLDVFNQFDTPPRWIDVRQGFCPGTLAWVSEWTVLVWYHGHPMLLGF